MNLPSQFSYLFPEFDIKSIDLDKHSDIVIERILRYGGVKEIRWLFKNYSKEKVKEFLRIKGKKRLDKRDYNFWEIILNGV